MQLPIIQIGNSKGIRLNKVLLEKYHIQDKVELVLEKDCIILKPISAPRQGWENAFKEMHQNGHDQLLMDDIFAEENWD